MESVIWYEFYRDEQYFDNEGAVANRPEPPDPPDGPGCGYRKGWGAIGNPDDAEPSHRGEVR